MNLQNLPPDMLANGAFTGARPADAARTAAVQGLKPMSVEKAAAAAQDFEAMFLSQMLKPIFNTVGADDEFGGGQAEETYRDLLVTEYGKQIAKHGGIGIAAAVQKEMLRQQEFKAS
jgi:peptidoglycan hydrolase FlgJ